MIICFTATGNTRRVAQQIQDALGDELVRFAPGLMNKPDRVNLQVTDGRVIWCFPVHSWGIPKVTAKAIEQITLNAPEGTKHYLVCTCGDDIGLTHKQWRRALAKRGWQAAGAYSVQMPNTYTFMAGFDVDKPEVAEAKLAAMPARVDKIIDEILAESTTDDVVTGGWAWVKSRIVYPWFMRFKTGTKPFHTTDACRGCGKCAGNCPMTNIRMLAGRPVWGPGCTMCTRCYHICPWHAVEYGKATRGKGQYLCPGYTLKG